MYGTPGMSDPRNHAVTASLQGVLCAWQESNLREVPAITRPVLAARTPQGGWTRRQLAEWSVPWPLPKGWRKQLENGYVAERGAERPPAEARCMREISQRFFDFRDRSGGAAPDAEVGGPETSACWRVGTRVVCVV